LSVADPPGPEQPEALAVPANHGFRLNDDQGRAPADPELGQPCPEESISGGQLRSLDRTLQDPRVGGAEQRFQVEGPLGSGTTQKRREQCCENEGWGESTEGGQLPLYQPNRNFREPQFLRLPRARPYGLPPFCSRVFPRNSPVGCVWQALLVQFSLRLRRRGFLGGNRCYQPLRHCLSSHTLFSSLTFVGWIWTLLKTA
jgi:hypothetical protein